MMTDIPGWQKRMATASLRGFSFLADSHDGKGGRRLVVHEFPGAEDCVVEDLGGKAWDWKLNSYFIGPDYDQERDKFLEVLNTPGPEWLLHPWLGRRWVRARDWSIQESNDKGGYCTVAVDFVPGGREADAPAIDQADDAAAKIDGMADSAEQDFNLMTMSAEAFNAFVAAVDGKLEMLRQVISLASLPLSLARRVVGIIQGVKGDLAVLMGMPGAYSAAMRSLSDALVGGGAELEDSAIPRVASRLVAAAKGGGVVALSGAAGSDQAVKVNLEREEALRSRLLVSAAAQVALADYRSAEDRDAALGCVVTAIDGLLPGALDPVFQASVAARTALIEALMAQDLDPAVMREVVSPLPATVLAHRMGVDEDAFISRNRVRHPLFVQGKVYG